MKPEFVSSLTLFKNVIPSYNCAPLAIDFCKKYKDLHVTCLSRWKVNDPAEHGDSWKQLYCERHLWEYLESLNPTYFESLRQECEELLDLVHQNVHVLKLRELQPVKQVLTLLPRCASFSTVNVTISLRLMRFNADCMHTTLLSKMFFFFFFFL
jgi:hypothetical protein